MTDTLNILRLDASARQSGSVSRDLADNYMAQLRQTRDLHVHSRDVSKGLPVITQDWVTATFTPADVRTEDDIAALTLSDQLVEELETSDLIVISTPIYNFNIPASLKLWVDQVARAGRTFKYTENGPVGLLTGKRVIVFVASGGTKVGSPIDFATPYLRHVFGFLGISDVEFITADQLMARGPKAVEEAKEQAKTLAN